MAENASNSETQSLRGSDPRDLAKRLQESRRIEHPKTIGPYKILEVLGEGGMGLVYLAEQEKPIHRRVALKIIKLGMDTHQVIARFETEREALALMNHPNVARVLDAGATEDGRPYFVMEHVAGIAITDYCDKHRLTTQERLKLFADVCHAVQHAHQKGIIHRDIKPSNVLVTEQDGKAVPKVIDFGIAKATQHSLTERTLFTELGQLIGTPGYMSPEQAGMTALGIDTRTDVYSLGVLLYELLVGRRPFDDQMLRQAGFAEIQRIIREVEPPKPSTRLSSLGEASTLIAQNRHTELRSLTRALKGDLDWITMKAMEKDRNRRYSTAAELASDIARHLGNEPVLAGAPGAGYRLRKFVRRNRVTVTACFAFVLILLAGVLATGRLAFRLADERNRALASEEQEAKQRRMAEDHRDEAQATTIFLAGMLTEVDPSRARGHQVTVREVLDNAAKQIDGWYPRSPLVQGTLRMAIGDAYVALGLYSDAEPHLRMALELIKRRLGNEHRDVAGAMASLANALEGKGEYDSSKALFQGASAITRKLRGEELFLFHTLICAAKLHFHQGEYESAESSLNESQALLVRFKKGRKDLQADVLHLLAEIKRARGDPEDAEQRALEALEIYRTIGFDKDPHFANCLDSLGVILIDKGDLQQAEAALREALEINKKLFDHEHPFIATGLCNLGDALFQQGTLDEAEPLVREGLAMQRKLIGNDNVQLSSCLNVLGKIVVAQGRAADAESVLRESLALLYRGLPRSHWTTAYTENLMGATLVTLGRYAEAEPLLLAGYSSMKRVRGEQNRYSVECLRHIIELYRTWGRLEKMTGYLELLKANERPK